MSGFISTFILVAIAELGDKTQLLALSFATKHRPVRVLAGIGAAIVLLQLLASILGRGISGFVPTRYLEISVGLLFVGFGLWGLRNPDDEDQSKIEGRNSLAIIFSIASAFFLAELGDKTQLATLSLAARYNSFLGVWAGSALGLFLVDAFAVALGFYLGKKMPRRQISYIASAIFVIFGIVTLTQAFR